MLRSIFGEPPRKWEGAPAEAVREIESYIGRLRDKANGIHGDNARFRKYAIWSEGLLRSLDELEQSRYAAFRFGSRVTATIVKELGDAERLDYDRYVYFDKNAYIRIFALLDKLGTLLNDALSLETEKVKPHFSYFTVLRRMRQDGRHRELGEKLGHWKEAYKPPLDRLRKRRNTEVHHMNAELQDDLLQSLEPERDLSRLRLEDLSAQLNDLEDGWDMVVKTLAISFAYLRSNAE
ncbi:Cthe_2314 family HEPN domain-containing protein [Cohnella massiliensis]|uniref:Cthe_2314 family HEPN domain-containing protein n=1 Tax=Cohnella massiliensis TaxID=1816691 RepID=UPI0009BBE5B6|nr:Cthe_2314 family HEPN domain-containing protein [Cohnella massiliensis]